MLFNSIDYLIFLPVVFFLHWFLGRGKIKFQNILLLAASYFFYSCWDWRFVFLLIFSTLLDYFTGLQIFKSKNIIIKKFWFYLSIITNLGFLCVFKYYNFFVSSTAHIFSHFKISVHPEMLSIILPIGISFYTFHGLSYVIDIYKGRIKPEQNFVNYALFVSFFPLLIAGPIERATHLLPQIQQPRRFDYMQAVDGLRQMLWGFFKKIVIADNCADYANLVFGHPGIYAGSTHIMGALFFAFQIYADFSGYSDIALGTAKLFGINLLRNFSYPYFSRDIAEFWRRWHISLSSWFKDYVYKPLGGSRGTLLNKVRNIFIIFLLSGLWHGANWTFVIWGLLNAIYYLPIMLANKNRNHLEIVAKGKLLPSLKEAFNMTITFGLTVFAWIFFRAKDLGHAKSFIHKIFSQSLFSIPQEVPLIISLFVLLFMFTEWMGRDSHYAIQNLGLKWSPLLRYSFYYFIIITLLFFSGREQQFIYFQF